MKRIFVAGLLLLETMARAESCDMTIYEITVNGKTLAYTWANKLEKKKDRVLFKVEDVVVFTIDKGVAKEHGIKVTADKEMTKKLCTAVAADGKGKNELEF